LWNSEVALGNRERGNAVLARVLTSISPLLFQVFEHIGSFPFDMPTVAECSTEVNESLGASGPRFSQETALAIEAFLPSEKKNEGRLGLC